MCSPTQSPLPPPSPPIPSRFSQCTRSEHLSHASNLGVGLISKPAKSQYLRGGIQASIPLTSSPRNRGVHLGQEPVPWAGGTVPGPAVSAWGPVGDADLGVRRRPNGSETPGVGAQFCFQTVRGESGGTAGQFRQLLLSCSSFQPGHDSPRVGHLFMLSSKKRFCCLKMTHPGQHMLFFIDEVFRKVKCQ